MNHLTDSMSVVYIGKFFPEPLMRSLLLGSKGKLTMSNHNFEMSIVKGLLQQEGIEVEYITIPGVYSFPHNNRNLFTKSISYKYANCFVSSIGFCNLVFVKEIWSTVALILKLIRCVKICKDNKVDVIINTPDYWFLKAVHIVKIFTKKRITQTVIIPDIPSIITSMDRQGPLKGWLLKSLDVAAMKAVEKSNGLVLLTEAMMDFVDKPIHHIVMEGIVDVDTMDGAIEDKSEKKIILYTGTLRKIFGVMNLIEAFQLVDDIDAELWVCGSGDSQELIENAAKLDSRIKYFGLVDSQTALEMQRKATILVNPRTSDGEYTKYSFPSKTMEYLLSGKITVINRLPGIPEEYYDYVYTPKDESVEALAECLSNLLIKDFEESSKKARLGKNFVVTQKNSKVQTRRILDMISRY